MFCFLLLSENGSFSAKWQHVLVGSENSDVINTLLTPRRLFIHFFFFFFFPYNDDNQKTRTHKHV